MYRKSLLVSVALSAAVAACPALLEAQTRSRHPQQLSGTWTGVYQVYPNLLTIQIQIPAPGQGRMETELRVEPLVESRAAGRARIGVARVTIEYEPASGTFSLAPVAAARQTGLTPPQLSGVIAGDVIAGVVVGARADASPYFLLARSPAAEDSFLETLRSLLDDSGASTRSTRRQVRVPGLGNVSLGGRGDSPGERKLLEWAQRLTTEYPEVETYRTEMGKLFGMARPLFRDEHFRQYFGKTYDQLSRADREAVTADIRKIRPPRANFPEERSNGTVRALESAFRASATGTYAPPDITLSVLALRTIQIWRAASLGWMATAPAAVDTLAGVTLTETRATEVLGFAWPSERQTFGTAAREARIRLAGPVLTQSIDDLIRNATTFAAVGGLTSVLEQADAIPSPAAGDARVRPGTTRARRTSMNPTGAPPAPNSVPALLASLPAAARQPYLARLDARVDELVTAEARRDGEAIGTFGTGLEALRVSGEWEDKLTSKYGAHSSRPAVQALLTRLAERRVPLLQAAEPTLTARMQAAKVSSELAEVRNRYLSVGSDVGSPAGARLYKVALQRDAELRSAEIAKAAEETERRRRESSPCAAAPNTRSLGEEGDEPTARDMCLAYEQVVVGTQGVHEELKNDCKTVSANANPLLAFNCLIGMAGDIGGGPQLSLRDFEKIGCVRQGGGSTFHCNFAAGLSSGNPIVGPTVNRMAGEIISGFFTPRGTAWIYRR